LDSTVARTNQMLDAKVAVKYGKTAEHTLDFEAKVGKPTDVQTVLKVKTRSSRRSFLNFDVDWEVERSDNRLEHKLEYTRGVEEPKVHLSLNGKIRIDARNDFEILDEITFKHPNLNIDFHAKTDAKASPGQPRHADLTITANSLKASVKYENAGTGLRDYSVKANVSGS
jgi:hypothetical protein